MQILQRKETTIFLNKNLTYLSHLLTLTSEGRAWTNHPDSLCAWIIVVYLLRNLNRTIGHLLHPTCGSQTRLPSRIVQQHLSSFVGILNQKHISTMANTSNASQLATMAD